VIAVVLVVVAARYWSIESDLQHSVFPLVRTQAAEVRALASPREIVEISREERRAWFDPFCEFLGIPPNRLSVITNYQILPGRPPTEVIAGYQSGLAAQGWRVQSLPQYGPMVGWQDRFRVQIGSELWGVSDKVTIEVRNEPETAESGCFR
jgi:hypothetical protein